MKADSTSDPLLSLVVVNWNRAPELERCVQSVLAHTLYTPLELIVVDNGSTDDSVRRLDPHRERITLIENAANAGAAAARNQGMRAAQGELVGLLDCDTYVVDDVIGRAARALLERPEIGMLSCTLCFPDGRRQHSAHRAMSIRLSLLQNLWLYRLLPKDRRAAVLLGGYWDEDREIEVDWLTGAFVMLRRRLFVESGGFNPNLFPEDSEWGIRLSRAGHRILCAPKIGVVYHTGSVSDIWSDKEQLRRYHVAGLDAYRTLNGDLLAVFYRLAQLLGSAVRWAVYRAATVSRGDDYLREQATYYRALVDIYRRPHGPRPTP